MNFIDAHKIVHGYIDAIANNKNKDALMYYSKAFLPFEYDEELIINAFKLFFAHMIFYHTCTQEKYEQYKMLSNLLHNFVDKQMYEEIIYFNKIANGNRPILKKKLELYNIAINKRNEYMKKMDEINKKTWSIDYYESFFSTMQKKNNEFRELYKDDTTKLIGSYVEECYTQIGIEIQPIYYEFFFTFSVLRKLLENELYRDNYKGYENYIMTHR